MNLPADGTMSLRDALELGTRLSGTELARRAATLRDRSFGSALTYSPKVFIPLTRLCRDVCHYCTFAKTPRHFQAPFLEIEEVLAIASSGERAGCREALFTLGEKPELRYRIAAEWLAERGYASTVAYVAAAAEAVLRETRLIPHINAGTLSRRELVLLKASSGSMGLMIESGSKRLLERGGAHHGSPDKRPWRRWATLVRAGQLGIPMTTGLLVGIGETREERVRDLVTLRRLSGRWGHIQEVIIQNFRAKAGTRMAHSPEPDQAELCWTIAMARLVLGAGVSIQAPPNLSPGALPALIDAGLNDWGGISPVTPDHVNPEAPWPEIEELERQGRPAGKRLLPRLTVYPRYLRSDGAWLSPAIRARCLAESDSEGFLRDSPWQAGESDGEALPRSDHLPVARSIRSALQTCIAGELPGRRELHRLLQARGSDFEAVLEAADGLRREQVGDDVSFVVNRNINYTNVCQYACHFCAFSKNFRSREQPYDIDGGEILRRCTEAVDQGATEVCLQGGIHPDYTGDTYLTILRTIRGAFPDLHIHAFSPLEVTHGAETLGLPVREYLLRLQDAGLNTLPGTAAEILTDRVRAILCPDKLDANDWLEVMRTAHEQGIRSTATMMFGHVDNAGDWIEHMLRLRTLQSETGGFTEFVPLPFVAREAPIARRGLSRAGPTLREALLVHAVARLVLGAVIPNIQTSWVKMGRVHSLSCLSAGANDLGGTLINESITRAAGARHGQWWTASEMSAAIRDTGRRPRIRRTDYRDAQPARVELALRGDGIIAAPVRLAAGRRARSKAGTEAGTGTRQRPADV